MAVRDEYSVGGVALDGEGRVAIIRTRNLRGDPVWALPKGQPEPGESSLETALREVAEETGLAVEAAAEEPAHRADYWYTARDGARVHKRVDWFLMRITGETGAGPDAVEVEDVALLDPASAGRRLTYRGEQEALRMTLALSGP